jgi:hypothetical protein
VRGAAGHRRPAACPRHTRALSGHLRHLLSHDERRPGKADWTQRFLTERPDSSEGLRQAVAPILQTYARTRRARSLGAPIRPTPFGPEHIAQFPQMTGTNGTWLAGTASTQPTSATPRPCICARWPSAARSAKPPCASACPIPAPRSSAATPAPARCTAGRNSATIRTSSRRPCTTSPTQRAFRPGRHRHDPRTDVPATQPGLELGTAPTPCSPWTVGLLVDHRPAGVLHRGSTPLNGSRIAVAVRGTRPAFPKPAASGRNRSGVWRDQVA